MRFLDRLLGREPTAVERVERAEALYEAIQAASPPADGAAIGYWPSAQTALAARGDDLAAILRLACAEVVGGHRGTHDPGRAARAHSLIYTLTASRPVLPPEPLAALLDAMAGMPLDDPSWFSPVEHIVGLVRKPLAPEVLAALQRLRARIDEDEPLWMRGEHWWTKKVATQAARLLWTGSVRALHAEGPWSRRVLDDIAAMDTDRHDAWCELTMHLIAAADPAPSKKWLSTLAARLEAVGRDEALSRMIAWLALGPVPGETARTQMREQDAHYLKGFVWGVSTFADPAVPGTLADLAERCLKKIPGQGPVSARAASACVRVLARLPGSEPVAQLGRLRERVKYVVARQMIEKALAEAAERAGLTPEGLEEVAVPTFGLDAAGTLRRTVGEFVAEIRIAGSHEVSLAWVTTDGARRKGVPAAVRAGHAPTVAELKKTAKTIASVLPGQKARLERLMGADRSWPIADWRARYIEHPVVGEMARRLIWAFVDGDRASLGGVVDGRLVDVDDVPISWLTPTATVRSWHPIGAPAEQVQAWRTWLERHRITQPFKQAHREIYLITDAERATETYSNRFAGHVLRQHQFAALCRERGWRYQVQGGWDSHNTPTLRLASSDLDVQFWIDTPDDPAALGRAGIYDYVSTDQIRFQRDGTAVRLDTLPALTFSEAMRDVDLFVAVCSLGTDPAWADRGPGPFTTYWQAFAYGELTASASTRRVILEGLIPRLRGGERLAIEKSFLVVRGRLWTYKIHLGSGNILMEPGSRYLCIVRDRSEVDSRSGDVWLPFEGDHMLSIIISKALLLLKDEDITDPVIVRQIRR